MTIVYKIVLNEHGVIKTLFKAIEGSRTLYRDRWLNADKKMCIDGSGGKEYLSGIHCFKDLDKALIYLHKFKTVRPRTIIICEAKGLRQKPTNPDVYLADMIKLPKLINMFPAVV